MRLTLAQSTSTLKFLETNFSWRNKAVERGAMNSEEEKKKTVLSLLCPSKVENLNREREQRLRLMKSKKKKKGLLHLLHLKGAGRKNQYQNKKGKKKMSGGRKNDFQPMTHLGWGDVLPCLRDTERGRDSGVSRKKRTQGDCDPGLVTEEE